MMTKKFFIWHQGSLKKSSIEVLLQFFKALSLFMFCMVLPGSVRILWLVCGAVTNELGVCGDWWPVYECIMFQVSMFLWRVSRVTPTQPRSVTPCMEFATKLIIYIARNMKYIYLLSIQIPIIEFCLLSIPTIRKVHKMETVLTAEYLHI